MNTKTELISSVPRSHNSICDVMCFVLGVVDMQKFGTQSLRLYFKRRVQHGGFGWFEIQFADLMTPDHFMIEYYRTFKRNAPSCLRDAHTWFEFTDHLGELTEHEFHPHEVI